MRYLTLVAVFAVVVLAPSVSRADGPPGSYRDTCKHVKVRGDDLYARCKQDNGDYRDTRLDRFQRCESDIVNLNGELTCNREHNARGNGPNGSYSQTCREINVDGDTLFARCQGPNGGWIPARLEHVDHCSGDITNVEGQLFCNKGEGDRGYYPPGSYTQTCRDIHVDGDRIFARCQTANGDWNGTSLDDFRRCRSEIANDNGNLTCGRDRDDRDRDRDHRDR